MQRLLVPWVTCALFVGLALLVPSGASAPVAVEKCSVECDPQVANDNQVRTGKDPTNVILYGHFQNILDMAPLNAQLPHPDREPDINNGFLMPTIDTNTGQCVQGQTCADFHFKNNQFTMFSSPGFVEYLSDGSWYTHQEPGLAGDAKLVGEEIRLYWYMSAHSLNGQNSGSGTGASAPVGVMPQVGVYARMETGRFPFHGEIIAESADFDEHGPLSPERADMVTVPGQNDVYEFQIKMKIHKETIPSSHLANGFIVYINPYQVKTEKQEGVQFAQPEWRLRTGANFPPRLIVPIEETMSTVASSLTIFDDRLFVRWSLLSVMGSYDMRDNSLKLDVTGPSNVDPKAIDFIILRRGLDHDAHFKPVNATWAIDYVNFPMVDGGYEVTMSILNHQGTYQLVHKLPFKVVDGKPDVYQIGGPGAPGAPKPVKPAGDSPDIGLLAILGVLGAVGSMVRRRR